MKRHLAILRLGLRLTRGVGWRGLARLGVTAAGVAVASFALLCASSVPHVMQERRFREAAREPLTTLEVGRPTYRCTQVRDSWRGRSIIRTLIEVEPGAPVPPGLDRLPAPGHAALSPALRDAMREDPALARRFPDRPSADVRPAGLVSPRDLIAYVGLPSGALGDSGTEMQRFGLPLRLVDGLSKRLLWSLLFGFAVFVLAPVLVLVAVLTRLSARARAERWRALRVLGASAGSVRALVATEALSASIAGAAAGLVAFRTVVPRLASVSIGSTSVFSSDVQPAVIGLVLTMLGLPLIAAAIALAAASPAVQLPLTTRPRRGATRRRCLALLPLALSLLVLLVVMPTADLADMSRDVRQQAVYAALVLAAVGMPMGLGVLVQRGAASIARSPRRVVTLLAARTLEADPGGFTRMVGLLSTVVLAAGFSQAVLSRYDGSEQLRHELEHLQRNGGRPMAEVRGAVGASMDPASYRARDGVRRAIPRVVLYDLPGGSDIGEALVASCADLQDLSASPIVGCVDGRVGRIALARHEPPDSLAAFVVRGQARWTGTIEAATTTITLEAEDSAALAGVVVLPPGLADLRVAGGPDVRALTIVLTSNADALDRLRDRAPQLTLDARVQVPFSTDGVIEYLGNARWVLLGASAALGLGGLGLAAGAADGITARRRRIAAQVVIGMPGRILRQAAFLELLGPLLCGVVVSVTMATLSGIAYTAVVGAGRVSPSAVVELGSSALVFSFALAWTMSRAVGSRLRPDLLRVE